MKITYFSLQTEVVDPSKTDFERESIDSQPANGWNLIDFTWFRSPSVLFAGIVYTISIGVVFFAAIIGIKALWFLWVTAPTSADDVTKHLLAVGAVLAIPFVIWRLALSHWSTQASRLQSTVARESHYTTLFTKAVEQLGSVRDVKKRQLKSDGSSDSYVEGTTTEPNIEVRLGAIYALERIAQDSERDHWPIMETLCAYVRENAGRPVMFAMPPPMPDELSLLTNPPAFNLQKKQDKIPAPRTDVQVALSVIGRRSAARRHYEEHMRTTTEDRSAFRLDLTNTNLNRASLDGKFLGHANFDGSSLVSASFRYANVDFASFVECDLSLTHFLNASLNGVTLNRSSLIGSNFINARGVGIEAGQASFVEAMILNANFDGSHFCESAFSSASLGGTSFKCADFSSTDLSHSNGGNIDFECASLADAKFNAPEVKIVSLRNAVLYAAQLLVGELPDDLVETLGDNKTILEEAKRPKNWSLSTVEFTGEEYTTWLKLRRQRLSQLLAEAPEHSSEQKALSITINELDEVLA